jgi:exopolysaccharide biosynthesis predicted pyruvyltransferase EpsI
MNESSSNFGKTISSLSGSRVFFEELKGNNGDALIQMGMNELFKRHALKPVPDPEQADVILLNGGGAMNDLWPEGGAQVIDGYLKRFPTKEVVVGPSSFYFTQLDFAAILRKARAGVRLFCREQNSHDFLSGLDLPENVGIELSQDLAFELRGSDFVAEQRSLSSENHILCAMRKDREGQAGVLAKTSGSWLPKSIRKPLSKLRDRMVAGRSSGLIDQVLAGIPAAKSTEVLYRDVSVSVDFDGFCRAIREARAIITNRLHIAILGTLLDKEVHLVRGSYHKIQGVYDFSLKDNPKVRLY